METDATSALTLFPDSIAIIIIAALLSLLPVVVLLWVYYMREGKPTVTGNAISRFFLMGILAVGGAVLLERGMYALWHQLSPETSGIFFENNAIPSDLLSIFMIVLVSFGIIALIEEGIRYVLFRLMLRRVQEFDQMIDGVQYGFALGLGFAFVENTIYFLELFRNLEFNTLVVVFFLRFLISTLGHLTFGGVMGYFLAHAEVFPAERERFLRVAFFLPWLMHGLFDFLLTIQLSYYIVLLLTIPLLLFWNWWHDERLFHYHVFRGRRLRFPVSTHHGQQKVMTGKTVEVLPAMKSCPNCFALLKETDTACPSCGLKLHRRQVSSPLPFLLHSENTRTLLP